MTPQEQDLITSLLNRLQQAGNQPKDADAAELIRRGMSALPDAPYLLVQTVLIQDMALSEAHNRIKEMEQRAAAPPQQPASFLAGARSVPSAGPWGQAAPPPAAPSGQVWTQSAPPAYAPAAAMAPLAAPSATSSFLRQAATTAAGIAGGALLFQGIQSMFGAHYGSGFLSNTAMQPGLGETVVNNYYGSDAGNTHQADYNPGSDPGPGPDPNLIQADDANYSDPGQDLADNQDYGDSSTDV
jgi:uncharacterized protein